jgi:hypothetical protein
VEFVVHNHSSQPITAYVYEVSFFSSGRKVTGEHFRDSVMFKMEKAVMPDGEQASYEGGPGITDVQLGLRAAVFADGTTFGDPVWVERILRRRQYALEEIDRGLAALARAQTANADLGVLAQEIESDRTRRLAAVTSDLDQEMMIRRFSNWLLHNINIGRAQGESSVATIQRHLRMATDVRGRLGSALPLVRHVDQQSK